MKRSLNSILSEPIPGCVHFYWKEALLLREIDSFCFPTEEQEGMIIDLAIRLENIRVVLGGIPIYVTSWIRPGFYNELIGGSKNSWHKTGGAVDFKCLGVHPDETRETLLPHLLHLGLRMEDLPGSSWVHVDTKPVSEGMNRFFKP